MTPEKDVNNKHSDEQANADDHDAQAEESGSVKTEREALNGAASGDDTDDSLSASDASSDDNESAGEAEAGDDIDRAADAQDNGELESEDGERTEADSESAEDDPLGFGNQKMGGEGNDGSDLESRLAASEAKVQSQADQLLRMQAEMENQRKRAQNDVNKAHKFALEKFALDLLPVKDSLEMGLHAAKVEDAEPSKIIEGSELTLKMLAQALEKYNIVEVNPIDEKFDPEFHQAMSMQPVEGKEPNTVASVMQKGYLLNDRLIRPALVMVAK